MNDQLQSLERLAPVPPAVLEALERFVRAEPRIAAWLLATSGNRVEFYKWQPGSVTITHRGDDEQCGYGFSTSPPSPEWTNGRRC